MNDPSRPAPEPHVDGTIGSVTTQSKPIATGNKGSITSATASVSTMSNENQLQPLISPSR